MARNIRPVEDYTKAALWTGFVNLLWIFMVIWGLWGFAAVLLTALFLNHAITLLERRKTARGD